MSNKLHGTGLSPAVRQNAEPGHSISHSTTEKALAVLKDEGIVRGVIVNGYHVAEARGIAADGDPT